MSYALLKTFGGNLADMTLLILGYNLDLFLTCLLKMGISLSIFT